MERLRARAASEPRTRSEPAKRRATARGGESEGQNPPDEKKTDLLQGTLDMLVLQTLRLRPAHGYTIARLIGQRSEAFLQVEQGSLYPALNRLEDRGWVDSYWDISENNRRARFYRLTPKGRRQLQIETESWDRLVRAIGLVMRPMEE
jgi:transcriptional regulator